MALEPTVIVLQGARETVIDLLAVPLGRDKATKVVSEAETYVRSQAEAGAKQAIPTIKGEVAKTVRPFVIASLALGGLGALLGTAAYLRTRRK
jgi:hypothetical protein